MNAFDVLHERGFVYQTTDADRLRDRLDRKNVTFYVGFDPTGSSLHIGHLLPIMAMRQLQKAGHRPIALVGGATAMVGDPSGKTEARPILTREEIAANAAAIKGQLMRFLDFGDERAAMVDNADWLCPLNYIEFLRDVGRHFSVNRMLAAESVKLRLETGLSFLEFNYMLLQAYDFYVLRRERACELQLGGQDQWGNILAGVDLTRRILQEEVHGVTFPLLLKSDGTKFGKTASGAVWLDANRTSPFHYYQFWRNVDDSEVGRLLGFFSDLPMDEIRRFAALPAPAINRAKEILAFEATRLAHGGEAAREAYLAAGTEFGFSDPDKQIPTSSDVAAIDLRQAVENLPTHVITGADLATGVSVVKLLAESGLCGSNSDARRLIRAGGAYLGDERVQDDRRMLSAGDFAGGSLLLRAGKKNVRRIVVQ